MELKVQTDALAESFSVAQSVATTRSTRPVLQNALLSATKEGVSVAATDMEIGITWKIPAEKCTVSEDVEMLLPADRMSRITRSIGAEEITLSLEENVCTVKGARSVFEVMTENVEDFPRAPELPGEKALEIEWAKFTEMVKKTTFAAARESTRYALNGVHMAAEEGRLEMVATDGRRMALMTEKLGGKIDMPEAIVPQKAFAHIERLEGKPDEKVGIYIGERQIFFASENGILVSRLVEGHFPPYRDVIPKETNKKMTASRTELLSAMRQAAIMTSEESRSVVLSFDDGRLTVTGRAPDEGRGEVTLDIEYEGEPLEIRFNPQFVIDALTATGSAEVTMEMKEPASPAAVKDGTGFLYVVMPINIS